MSNFDPQSFDLTVTSPPYDALRDYHGYTFDFDAIAAQLWSVTKRGGVVVWVVGDQTKDGSESGTSFRQALEFMELGFNLHDTMIYEKSTSPFPQHVRYNQLFEFMFVFSKDSPSIFNPIRIKSKTGGMNRRNDGGYRQRDGSIQRAKYATRKKDKTKGNIWRYAVGGAPSNGAIHPASFPEALARDHIISWSSAGDLVLDPLCGSGTTGKMAQQLGRRFVGIDCSEDYCAIAVERLRQPSFWSLPSETPPEAKAEQGALMK